MTAYPVVLIVGVTLLLSLLLPIVVRPMLARFGVVDVPNARSSHAKPVLRGMGLAVLVAMLVGYIVALLLFGSELRADRVPAAGEVLWALSVARGSAGLALLVLLAAVLGAGLVGLSEDVVGLSVLSRSVLLLTVSAVVGGGMVWFAGVSWWLSLLLLGYAMLFVSGYVNVANFMDGLNGISGFHGVIAGVTFAVIGWLVPLPWLLVAGLVLAAGFAGFLPWNLKKSGVFLGDVGSYLLGGATATISLLALVSGVPILATIGPMVIYFGDVGVTLVRRVCAGKHWHEAHNEHVYQRLQQQGSSHVAASIRVALASIATSALGLGSLFVPPAWWLVLLIAGLAVLIWYLRQGRQLVSA